MYRPGFRLLLQIRREFHVTPPKSGPAILFVALGNPTPQFEGTRHNVGKWALGKMISEAWPDFGSLESSKQYGVGLTSTSTSTKAEHSNVLMAETTRTFMNVSGPPVHKVWSKFKQQYAANSPCLVVLHDELNVPLGKVQIRRRNTSARGHNGLRSIDKSMGNDYTKLAIGIGKPREANVPEFVLSKFKPDERQVLDRETMPLLMDIMDQMVKGKHIYDKV